MPRNAVTVLWYQRKNFVENVKIAGFLPFLSLKYQSNSCFIRHIYFRLKILYLRQVFVQLFFSAVICIFCVDVRQIKSKK